MANVYNPAKTPGRKPPLDAEIPAGPGGCLAGGIGAQVADVGNLVEAVGEDVTDVKVVPGDKDSGVTHTDVFTDLKTIRDTIVQKLPVQTDQLSTKLGAIESVPGDQSDLSGTGFEGAKIIQLLASVAMNANVPTSFVGRLIGSPDGAPDGEDGFDTLFTLVRRLEDAVASVAGGPGGSFAGSWLANKLRPVNPALNAVPGEFNTVLCPGVDAEMSLGSISSSYNKGSVMVAFRESGAEYCPSFDELATDYPLSGDAVIRYVDEELLLTVLSSADSTCHIDILAVSDNSMALAVSVLIQP